MELAGAYRIELDRNQDERGFFARTFDAREFESRGMAPAIAQCSTSFNLQRGTVRGLHYQAPPFEEAKLVRCTAGAICDIIVDIRDDSATFGHWVLNELTSENRSMVYIPPGFAHGFQTLQDNSEILYQITAEFDPGATRGIRWDDETLRINWPIRNGITISERDAAFGTLRDRYGTSLDAVGLRSTPG